MVFQSPVESSTVIARTLDSIRVLWDVAVTGETTRVSSEGEPDRNINKLWEKPENKTGGKSGVQ